MLRVQHTDRDVVITEIDEHGAILARVSPSWDEFTVQVYETLEQRVGRGELERILMGDEVTDVQHACLIVGKKLIETSKIAV